MIALPIFFLKRSAFVGIISHTRREPTAFNFQEFSFSNSCLARLVRFRLMNCTSNLAIHDRTTVENSIFVNRTLSVSHDTLSKHGAEAWRGSQGNRIRGSLRTMMPQPFTRQDCCLQSICQMKEMHH